MKKAKVNENRWNSLKQTSKRKVAGFVGGATKKWEDFAVYALETENRIRTAMKSAQN